MFYVNYLLVCFRDYDSFGCSFTSVLVLFATDVTCLEYHPWFQYKRACVITWHISNDTHVFCLLWCSDEDGV